MAKSRIPSPGKKWTDEIIKKMALQMNAQIYKMDRAELEAIILTAETFTETNCGWTSYYCKDAILKLAKSRLFEITPSSQHKRNPILKRPHH